MIQTKSKTGKDFEALITWINECLHKRGIVKANDKIRDVHTGTLRQIDISIRIEDGPSNFLSIVEVRDRSRPVGEDYIEQVRTKRESVNADVAVIVSKSGFYNSAIKKAKALNIRIFTLKEAISSDWMTCLELTKMIVRSLRFSLSEITFFGTEMHVIDLHPSIVGNDRKVQTNAKIVFDSNHQAKFSAPEICRIIFNQNIGNIDNLGNGQILGTSPQRKMLRVQILSTDTDAFFVKDTIGQFVKVERIGVTADFWVEMHDVLLTRARYSDATTGRVLAETASATADFGNGPQKFDLIAQLDSGDSRKTSSISLRIHKLVNQ